MVDNCPVDQCEKRLLVATMRRIRAEVIGECISAIQNHHGFSEDEKRIATAVLYALEPSFADVGGASE